jgi:hypothetical protein
MACWLYSIANQLSTPGTDNLHPFSFTLEIFTGLFSTNRWGRKTSRQPAFRFCKTPIAKSVPTRSSPSVFEMK